MTTAPTGSSYRRRPHLAQPWRSLRATPLVLAHRGDSAHFPENTMEAFAGAMEAGADGFELDVRLCKSGEVVVFHDEDLARLIPGDTRRVSDVEWDELAALRVAGCAIPTLAMVLRAFPTAVVNIELKTHPMGDALALVRGSIAAVEEARALGRVLVSSFDPRLLLLLRVLEPNIGRGLLFAAEQGLPLRRGWLARSVAACAVHPEHVLVSKKAMKRWRARSYRIHTWTIDDPTRIAELAQLGVHAIICNDPGAARRVLEAP